MKSDRPRPMIGAQVRRRRRDRDLTLAEVAERTGLNVGYLSQVENDKASPSLETLASLAEALAVPITWFLLDASPAPRLVRLPSARRRLPYGGGAMSQVDGGTRATWPSSRASSRPASGRGSTPIPGDEHHVILSGRVRFTQGDTVMEAGPGDYVLLDGTIAHDVEVVGDEGSDLLIIYAREGPTGPA